MDEITQAPKMFIAVTIISEIKKKRKLRHIRISFILPITFNKPYIIYF